MGKHLTLYQTKGCCSISKHLVFIPVKQRLHFLSGDTKVSDAKLLVTVCSELSLSSVILFRACFLTQSGLDLPFTSALLWRGSLSRTRSQSARPSGRLIETLVFFNLAFTYLARERQNQKTFKRKLAGRRSPTLCPLILKPSFT